MEKMSYKLVKSVLGVSLVMSLSAGTVLAKSDISDPVMINSLIKTQSPKEIFLNYLSQNSHLQGFEKEALLPLGDTLNDYPMPTDKLIQVCEAISNVTIIYRDHTENQATNIAATYNSKKNIITIYNGYEDNLDHIILHEGYHLLSTNDILPLSLGQGFNEGMTELLTDEYGGNQFDSYPTEVSFVKILSEIIPTDKLMETYQTQNINVLIDYLKTITDEKTIIAFFSAWDNYKNSTDPKMTKQYYNDIVDNLKIIFYNKYNYDMEDNLIIKTYLGDPDYQYERIFKGYFNKSLYEGKTYYQNVTTTDFFTTGSEVHLYELTETNTKQLK